MRPQNPPTGSDVGDNESPRKKCWIFTHKWTKIYRKNTSIFEGIEFDDPHYTNYLKCLKCGTIQEFSFDSQGGSWMDLSKEKTKILNLKIKWENGKLYIPQVKDLNNRGDY